MTLYFYLPIILLFALPWTPFLIEALCKSFKDKFGHSRADDAQSRSLIFFLAWLLFPLVFFSLSRSKLPGYVLPSLPAVAPPPLPGASGRLDLVVARFMLES